MASAKKNSPTLSDAAYGGRFLIKFGAIALVVLMVGRVVLNMSVNLYKFLNPPKAPPPTYGFGTLPPLEFPSTGPTIASYTLQTKTGTLPKLVTQLPVFFMPKQSIGVLSLDEAKKQAAALGFAFAPEQTSTTTYRWKRNSPLPATLDIDIVSKHLTMKVDWASDPGFLSQKSLPPQQTAITQVRETLQEAGLSAPDMATSGAKISFLRASGTSYIPAVSLSEADFIQVNIWRSPIRETYSLVRPDPLQGNAHFIFSGSRDTNSSIVQADFSYAPIDYERFETYGLIAPQTAWQTLQAGKGFVAHIDTGVQQATVRNVYLAYYESDTPQRYLQPVYVFVGDQNFFAYVPAVAVSPTAPSSQSSNR